MDGSVVSYVDSKAPVKNLDRWFQPQLSLINKLERLVEESGALEDIKKGDVVALKTHFGDHGTTRPLRSVYVRKISEMIQKREAHPFVTETTGLGMVRDRNTSIGRLKIAAENGYTAETVSAPIIIADGLKGFDIKKTNIDGLQLKEVYVAQSIVEADKVVVLTHVKGHMQGSMGGAMKNIGVGCVGKPSKFDIHFYTPPNINKDLCDGCMKCAKICMFGAIRGKNGAAEIIPDSCGKCFGCFETCDKKAIKVNWTSNKDMCERLIDCAKATLNQLGSENFTYINFLLEITPHCDCHPYSDNPIVSDLGILISKDIMAVDKASADLINEAHPINNSLASNVEQGKRKFENIFEQTDLDYQLNAAEKHRLGSKNYAIRKLEIPVF